MSHNILSEPTTRPDPSGNESSAFSQLRYSLIKVLRNSPESREPICDALELIESLQQQMEAKRHPDPAEAPRHSRSTATQQQQQQEYIVQKTSEGDFLTERRPSGSQPFRCPKPAYDAAAKTLADAHEPLHFEELLDRLNAATGERHADYRIRVCLRFWGQHKLIERFRTRYRALNAKTLVPDAEKLWEQLSR